ncbi:MAG: M1 family metallopeptidase [Bacteroidota bacterium]
MKKIFFFLILFTLSFFSQIQFEKKLFSQTKVRSYIADPSLILREHNVDFQHLKLEISFVPQNKLVKGKVTHYFVPLRQNVDSIVLDGIDINIKEASINGKPVKFKTDSAYITIFPSSSLSWNEKDSLTIIYEATPSRGLFFIGWNDKTGICQKQIWSQGQGIDNRCWIPMYDHINDKITTETIITFDTAYKVLSNGKFIEKKKNSNGTFTWHYKMSHPHASYLIMLGIGKYDIKETKSSSGVPIYLYYYPEWKSRVETTYMHSEKMMDFFEKEIGVSYPWENYSQIPVQDFLYGAMENTTATIFSDSFFGDDRAFLEKNYIGTNAHELAHQWFGDFVTANSRNHHWLQESFANHYEWMLEREVFGQDYFDWIRRYANKSSIEESKKNKYPIAHSGAGRVRHYQKGALVLNMLKYVCGREAFNKAIKYYLEKHKYKNVDSHDLLLAFEETLGMQLNWFWEQWVYKGGEPNYEVSFRDVVLPRTDGSKSITYFDHFSEFNVKQTHETSDVVGLFKMPIWFEVQYADGTIDKKQVWIEKQSETVVIPNPNQKKIDFVLFDPNNEILKLVKFEKPFDMLKEQAMKAKHMFDRYDALVAMRDIPIERKRELLFLIFVKETFHVIKEEIINQLIKDDNRQSKDIIKTAIKDKDAKVRNAVLGNIKFLHEDMLPEIEKLLKDSSYEIISTTLEYLAFVNPNKIPFYLEQTKDVEGFPGKNVKIKWLELACLTNEKYIDQLVSYVSNTYEFCTRVNAMTSLKKVNYIDQNAIEYIIDALMSENSRLSNPAADVLKYFYEQLAYKRIIIDYVKGKNWQPREEKIIKGVIN